MKKIYAKPILIRREIIGKITANGAGLSGLQKINL
jgi:hypothetical protein